MKYHKKLAAILVSCQLLMAFTGCSSNTADDSGSSSNSSSSSSSSSASSDAGETGSAGTQAMSTFDIDAIDDVILATAGVASDEVVARFGDKEITAFEMLYFTTSDLDQMNMFAMYGMGYIPWGEELDGVSYEHIAKNNGVELAAIYKTLPDEGEIAGFEMSDAMKEEIDFSISSIRDQYSDEKVFDFILWTSVLTEDFYYFINEANFAFDAVLEYRFGENGTDAFGEEEVAVYLDEAGYYKVKHILISTLDDYNEPYDEATKAERLAVAESILADLEGSGNLAEDFHASMLENSEDPGSLASPEGYSATPGMMVPEFEAGSLALAVGEMSGIVESDFGYHIIYRLPLEVEESHHEEYYNQLSMDMQEEWLAREEIELTDAFYDIDLQVYYDNLTALRNQLTPYIAAGTSELDFAEDEVEVEDETEAEVEEETEEEEDAETEEETEAAE